MGAGWGHHPRESGIKHPDVSWARRFTGMWSCRRHQHARACPGGHIGGTIHAVIGGFHLFQADEARLAWTAEKLASIGTGKCHRSTLHGNRSPVPAKRRGKSETGAPRWWVPSVLPSLMEKVLIPGAWQNDRTSAGSFL